MQTYAVETGAFKNFPCRGHNGWSSARIFSDTGSLSISGGSQTDAGGFKQAAFYFQKESDLWPESREFMGKMIRNAKTQGKRNNQSSSIPEQKISEE